ncbi:MAG: glycosyltransferase family 4 protein [Candidatus Magasanikbacteria bacterium]
MKKTLIVTLEYPPQVGGIATYVHEMALALDKDNVVVYAPKMKGDKDFDSGVPFKIIRKSPFFPRFLWPRWLRLVFQIWHIVKKEKIEVMLINHVLPVGYVGWILKKIIHVPYVIVSHGTDVLLGTRNAWKIKMMRKVVRTSEQVVFNSESLRGRFLRVLPEFETKTCVVYPCPEPDFFVSPDQNELNSLRSSLALQGKKVMLTIARFDEGKGFPHLVRLLPKLLEREPHLVWVVIGDGKKKKEFLEEVQKRSLQNVVRYIGEVPHSQLKKYYYLADIFVLLTHPDEGREEGLGMVFLEAAAAGIPVVAGKSGGVDEAVLHTKTGLVIDIHQQAMAVDDGIILLLQDKEYANTLGVAAKERMKTEFVWKNQLKKLEPWIS